MDHVERAFWNGEVCCAVRGSPIFVLNNFRLSTVLQILIFLPLTFATLSKQAFLLLSLLLCIHAFIHGTLALLWRSEALSVLQVPIHPFLLLVCFNVYSSSVNPYLTLVANFWGMALSFFGPLFIVMEGLSSLLVVQKLGQEGKKLVYKGENYQFVLLVAAAVAYVASAWWIVVVSLIPWFRGTGTHLRMNSVISKCRLIAIIIHPSWSRTHSICLLDIHWIRVATDKYHRVIWLSGSAGL